MLQAFESFQEITTHFCGMGDQILPLHDLQIGQGSGAANGVITESVQMQEGGDGVSNFSSRGGGPQGSVTGSDLFRHGHDIRLNLVMLGGEHLAGSSKPDDHLVDNQEDSVLIADPANPIEISIRRGKGSHSLHDGFGDEGRHQVGALELDESVEGIRAGQVAGRESEI